MIQCLRARTGQRLLSPLNYLSTVAVKAGMIIGDTL